LARATSLGFAPKALPAVAAATIRAAR
jgi:hypothetical protein